MNRDDILRMSREAGLWNLIIKYTRVTAGKNANPEDLVWSDVERFAALVAAAEREACARVCEDNAACCNKGSTLHTILSANAAAIRSRNETR